MTATAPDVTFLLPSAATVQRAFRGNPPPSEWASMLRSCSSLAKLARARVDAYATLGLVTPADRLRSAVADLLHVDSRTAYHVRAIDTLVFPQLPAYREGADQHTHTVGQVVAEMASAFVAVTKYLHDGRPMSTEELDRLSALSTGYDDYAHALSQGRCVMPSW